MPRLVQTEAQFDLPFPPEAVWDVFSKTDWLNRAAGLPVVTYRVTPLAEGGAKVMASARLAGLPMEWEEMPFQWARPKFYHVERLFSKGPIARVFGGMELQEPEKGATRLRVFSEFEARNSLGYGAAKFALAPKATRGMAGIVRHVNEFLRGNREVPLPKLERSAMNEGAFDAAVERLRGDRAVRQELVPLLSEYLRQAPDVELARIRPFAVARKWDQDRWEVLKLFLHATRAGLLDLSWEVLCPNCRSSRQPLTRSLAGLNRETHCEACQIRFDAEFDRSVELKFTLNHEIKSCEQPTFCLAGPGAKPHILAQTIVPTGGSKRIELAGSREGLRLRSPQVGAMLDCVDLSIPAALEAHPDKFTPRSGGQANNIEIQNPNPYPVVVALEHLHWTEDILTAARATNFQDFRDLFAREVISPSEQIVVGQQVILFTDLRGSTAMYCSIGDAPAYSLVRDHFGILHDSIARHRGAIVKTIGDAVMATFSNPAEALAAVREMHARLGEMGGEPQLLLKSGLHVGPCLAVNANDRLDYFGTTVNLAARLVDRCQGGDLVVSDDFFRRGDTETFLRTHPFEAEATETQFRGFEGLTKVWRIKFVKIAA